jgi:2,4-dienoyl-CoA reductase-like NADH-dependent reductase (Old Yellow Enzyme family)
MSQKYHRIAFLKTAQAFVEYLQTLGMELPFDPQVLPAPHSPLAQPLSVYGFEIGNRFCVLPMEGWDGTPDGRPSEYTFRRWRNFGLSGAKLIWGGEAVAVRMDGRANPNQLAINRQTLPDLVRLRQDLESTHRSQFGRTDDLYVGLQLTHSGRFARPHSKTLEPWLAYDHPLLNPRFGLPVESGRVLSDEQVEALVQDFIQAAALAYEAGFRFVDIKHCHGYLLHEFLSARTRPGPYGGSFENRTRLARQIITGIQRQVPGLQIGVRLSAFDFMPFKPGLDGSGEPVIHDQIYSYAFGGDGSGLGMNLDEPVQFLQMLLDMGVRLVCVTAGSPYYVPHIQRPAYFPPSDGYQPPEDPLVGVARQVAATARLKALLPDMVMVGSAYSYLQEYLPNVAQAVVRQGQADFVGLGRMVLSYPELPADVLAGKPLQRKRICRTFSDCTTAPRNGLISGCFPLDSFYKSLPEAETLERIKSGS